MSLKGYFADLVSSQPFGTADATQEASAAADAQLVASNADLVARGVWTQQQADAADADIAAGNLSTGINDVAGSINDTFAQAVADDAKNLAPNINQSLSAIISGILKSIPFSVWAIGVVVLFVWLGGLDLFRGAIRRNANR